MTQRHSIGHSFTALYFIDAKLLAIEFLYCMRGSWFVPTRKHPLHVYLLWTFFGRVTLTLTRWLSFTNLTRIAWRSGGR